MSSKKPLNARFAEIGDDDVTTIDLTTTALPEEPPTCVPRLSEKELKEEWVQALKASSQSQSQLDASRNSAYIPQELVEKYASALSHHWVQLSTASTLTDSQLAEIGIRIGHRREILSVVAVSESLTSSIGHRSSPHWDALKKPQETAFFHSPGDNIGSGSDDNGDAKPMERKGSVGASRSTRSRRKSTYQSPTTLTQLSGLVAKTYRTTSGVQWDNVQGSSETIEKFFTEMQEKRKEAGFPDAFDRAFADNQPMPIEIIIGSSVLLLLRVPDLINGSGSTVGSITNRFVLMFSPKRRRVLTYHRCQRDLLKRLTDEWDDGSVDWSVLDMVDRVIRRVSDTYVHGAEMLQRVCDDCENLSDRRRLIERLTDVQKKAQVFLRCLKAGATELEELRTVQGFEERCEAHQDQLLSLASMMEELVENVASTINMQMALDGFRSGVNMKVFTFLSIFCQPITVATGWYGMNWTNFPELLFDNGYFFFTGITLGVATLIVAFFVIKDLTSR